MRFKSLTVILLLLSPAPTSAFITLSVTSVSEDTPQPGDLDPTIAQSLAGYLSGLCFSGSGGTFMRGKYLQLATWFTRQSQVLVRGSKQPWWSPNIQPSDEMTYTCDSRLGSPTTADCERLQDALDSSKDTLQLAAGEVRFLSSSK